MRAMLIAFVAMAAIAAGADLILDHIGYSTREATSGAAVRSD